MTVAVSEVVKAMRKHEKSLSLQLEALRVLLHFMMPGKSSKNIIGVASYSKSENRIRYLGFSLSYLMRQPLMGLQKIYWSSVHNREQL